MLDEDVRVTFQVASGQFKARPEYAKRAFISTYVIEACIRFAYERFAFFISSRIATRSSGWLRGRCAATSSEVRFDDEPS